MNHVEIPQGPIEIRVCRADDGPRLRELRTEAIRNHPTAFGATLERTLATDWDARAAEYTGDGSGAIYFAERDGQLMGMTGVRRNTDVKSEHAADIWGVYVRPPARGCGIAPSLVNACCEWARDKGVALVRLTVVTENTSALGCYLRCGFRITGVQEAAIRWEGRFYDELLMVRWLDAQGRSS